MKKKIVIGLAALGTAVALVPLFAAFEAHVINVTAKIENALAVTTDKIDFGTVFPQEHLDKSLEVALSRSFLDEDRVDDVDYFIRQKPKCGVTNQNGDDPNNGTQLVGPTWTGHVVIGDNPFTDVVENYYVDCDVDRPDEVLQHPNPAFWLLPSLCEYISKDGEDLNDGTTPSFHKPWEIVSGDNNGPEIRWLDTRGRLAKSEQDIVDNWTIDLSVPCFGGYCAQDWASFVNSINPQANPDEYTQPIENEHKIFGCNLWIEVAGVSPNTDWCTDGEDNDNDGLIDEQDLDECPDAEPSLL